ncbi:glutamine synthetase family protein [Patulibacter defluvii]|uniref:glutamine synthetase family protein n=1 Tax=Patulibacter defluvii TaxID=3095358 RepID=UPI002A7558A3|nr:glutamine synthetase family protein [Patulibacter sp. DM4]
METADRTTPAGVADAQGQRAGDPPADDRFDAVIVATPDMSGRLLGRRHSAAHYAASAARAVQTCDIVLGWGLEHELLDGFATIGWEHGYGDLRLVPDPATLRPLGWAPRTGIVLADVTDLDGHDLAIAPRTLLRQQLERAREAGYEPRVTSELEFYVFAETPEQLAAAGHRPPTPHRATLQPELAEAIGRDDELLRTLFAALAATGIEVETAKTEYSPGQYEVTLVPTGVLEMADRHALYKLGTREVCRQHGLGASFMAKWDAGAAGSSAHLHLSLEDADGRNLFAADERLLAAFAAGLQHHAREFFLLWAPYPNSFKRLRPGTFAPANLSWGGDNRTVAFRATGRGGSRHLENRIPGADVNPYLAYAGLLAAGLDGVARELTPQGDVSGNAYDATDVPPLPASLDEAIEAFRAGPTARAAFGDAAVEHIAHFAACELEASRHAVTDWDRRRLLGI